MKRILLSNRARFTPTSPIRKLAKYANQAKEKGVKVYHFNIGQPDIASPSVFYNAMKEYTKIRELPTGKGFADIVYIPKKHSDKPAMIVELKYNKSAEGAIAQIKERKYVESLKEYHGKMLLVGINYDKGSKKHSCVIEKWNAEECN